MEVNLEKLIKKYSKFTGKQAEESFGIDMNKINLSYMKAWFDETSSALEEISRYFRPGIQTLPVCQELKATLMEIEQLKASDSWRRIDNLIGRLQYATEAALDELLGNVRKFFLDLSLSKVVS